MPDEQHHWSKNLNCWLEMFPSNAFQSESADLCSVGTHLLWQTSLLEVLGSKIASQVKQRKNHSTSSKEMAAGLLSGLAFPVSPEGNVSKRRSVWEQLCGAGSSTALLSGGTRRRAGLLAPTAAGHEGASQAVTRRLCSSRSSSVPSAGFCLGHSVQSCMRLLAQLQQKRCVASVFCAKQMGRDHLPPFPGTDSCLGAAQLAVTFQALSQAGVLLGVSRFH